MRACPRELPRRCPGGYASKATTRCPRRPAAQAVAAPASPSPTTATSASTSELSRKWPTAQVRPMARDTVGHYATCAGYIYAAGGPDEPAFRHRSAMSHPTTATEPALDDATVGNLLAGRTGTVGLIGAQLH